MRTIWAVLVAALLLYRAEATPDKIALATGSLKHICTMQAIRVDLVVTASHCVGVPGEEYTVYFVRGVSDVPISATLVWDGSFADYDNAGDIAFLKLDRPWQYTIPLSEILPKPGDRLQSVTYAFGIRHWTIETEYIGIRYVARFGWSLLFRGPVGGGASGAALIKDGKLVGTISSGSDEHRLGVGVPVGTIARALRDLDRRGPMPQGGR